VCGGNLEITAINEIHEMSPSVYFVSEGQVTEPPTVISGQVVSEINGFLLFSGN
jgi:hypothetical protein